MRLVPLRIGADLFVTKIAVLSLAMGLGVGFARLATTLFALDLGAQGVTLAAIAMAQGVGMLILGAPAGRWVANYGYRTVFIAGTVWAVATCLAIPFASNPLWLIFLVAFAGLAMPLRFVSFNAFFMSHLEAVGRHHAGLFRAFHILGMSFLGAMLAARLYPLWEPVGIFILAAIIFASNFFLLGDTGKQGAQLPPTGRAGVPALLASNRSARDVALAEFAIQALNACFAFYIVVIVVRDMGLPAQSAGIAVAVQGSLFVATLIFAGRLAIGNLRLVLPLGVILVCLALVILAFASGAAQIFATSAVLGIALGALQIANLIRFAELGERIGFPAAASINALSGPLGGVFGGAIGGLFESLISTQSALLLFIPLFVLLAVREESSNWRSPLANNRAD